MNDQLRDRAMRDPFIRQALAAYQSGTATYAEALETALVALSRERERLLNELYVTRDEQARQPRESCT